MNGKLVMNEVFACHLLHKHTSFNPSWIVAEVNVNIGQRFLLRALAWVIYHIQAIFITFWSKYGKEMVNIYIKASLEKGICNTRTLWVAVI